MTMKLPLTILAALALTSCATLRKGCDLALTGSETVAEIAQVLIERGVAVDIAQKVANAISLGQAPLAIACAAIPPAPVATVS